MQFDRAEPLMPAAPPVCGLCSRILSGTYYTFQAKSVCAACGERMKRGAAGPFDRVRFLQALVFGAGAVIVGGGLNWFVASRWDLYVGWLSLLAAGLVGFAVRLGSRNRGGRPYQFLAVGLSYIATAAMFLPILHQREGTLTLSLVLRPFWILIAAPFINGVQGLLLWSIIGFGLSLSWKVNRSLAVEVRGPFALGSTMPPDGSGGV